MQWPDYDRGRRSSHWGLAVALGLALGLALVLLSRWGGPPVAPALSAVAPALPTAAPEAPLKTASDFALPDLFDEALTRRLSDYAGQPVILNFWASWCVPCRVEMPALEQTYQTYRAEGLVVLGINETYIDDVQAARDFVRELGLTFPMARDDSGVLSDNVYRVIGLPTSVFINRQGKITHFQVGQLSEEQLASFSLDLVAGP